MKGYVRNKSAVWRHAMKRSIGPNQKIPMDDLYKQYGEKHNLEEGLQFVEWLRNIKLRDNEIWEVIYEDEKPKKESVQTVLATENKEVVKKPVNVSPHVKKEITSTEVANMPVRKAREELKKFTNVKLLKYALEEARQLANKDTMCRMLRKRIQELEIARR